MYSILQTNPWQLCSKIGICIGNGFFLEPRLRECNTLNMNYNYTLIFNIQSQDLL